MGGQAVDLKQRVVNRPVGDERLPPVDTTRPSTSGVFGSNSVAPEAAEPRVARDFQKRHRRWPSVTRPRLGRPSAHLLVS